MRTPAKKHTHILRTLFGFALSLLMLGEGCVGLQRGRSRSGG